MLKAYYTLLYTQLDILSYDEHCTAHTQTVCGVQCAQSTINNQLRIYQIKIMFIFCSTIFMYKYFHCMDLSAIRHILMVFFFNTEAKEFTELLQFHWFPTTSKNVNYNFNELGSTWGDSLNATRVGPIYSFISIWRFVESNIQSPKLKYYFRYILIKYLLLYALTV